MLLVAVCAGAWLGCSGEDPIVRTPGSARTREGLDALAAWLHDELVSKDPSRVSALLLSDEEIDAGFDSDSRLVLSEQLRSERRHVAAAVAAWGRFAGSRYTGFCARGAAALGAGERGLSAPTEAIERILVVGTYSGSEWAGWVRELVRTSEGFRLMKLPDDSPREGHPELDMWSCEVARRPGEGRPGRP